MCSSRLRHESDTVLADVGRGDDRGAYESLRRRQVAQLRRDVIDEMLVGDACGLVWEAARLRRIRALQEALAWRGLTSALAPASARVGRGATAGRSSSRDGDGRRQPALEPVVARSSEMRMDDMERSDRLVGGIGGDAEASDGSDYLELANTR